MSAANCLATRGLACPQTPLSTRGYVVEGIGGLDLQKSRLNYITDKTLITDGRDNLQINDAREKVFIKWVQ